MLSPAAAESFSDHPQQFHHKWETEVGYYSLSLQKYDYPRKKKIFLYVNVGKHMDLRKEKARGGGLQRPLQRPDYPIHLIIKSLDN